MSDRSVSFEEIGTDELSSGYGYVTPVGVDRLSNLRGKGWWDAIREMTEQDPTVGAILTAIEMTMRRVSFRITPSDDSNTAKEWAEFVQQCLDDMDELWPDKLSELLSFIPWGKCIEEIVYKRRLGDSSDPSQRSQHEDGRIGWRKWSYRAPETQAEWVRQNGEIIAWRQYKKGGGTIDIPMDKLLLIRTSARGGDPDGFSLLKRVYLPWYHKKEIQVTEAIGISRDLAGLFEVRVPDSVLRGVNQKDAETREYWKKVIRNIHRGTQEGIMTSSARDSTGNLTTETRLMNSGGARQFDTSGIIERYRGDMTTAFLASFLVAGMNKVGTQSLAETQVEVFNRAMSAWLDVICASITEQAIHRLMRDNGVPRELWPKMDHGDPDSTSLEILGQYVERLFNAGLLDTTDYQLVKAVHEVGGLPVPDETKFKQTKLQLVPPPTGTEQ